MANICFTGSTGFTLTADERFTEAADGTKTAQRNYIGDASELDSFLGIWPRGTQHPTVPGLYLESRNWSKTGGRCTVSLVFAGRVGGGTSSTGGATLVGRTLVARSVEISTSASGENKYIVEYRSPSATVAWVSNTDVTAPSKESAAGLTGLSPTIVSAVSTEGIGAIADASTAFTEGTEYSVVTLNDGFSTSPLSDPETGNTIWNVTEVWTRVIVDKAIT